MTSKLVAAYRGAAQHGEAALQASSPVALALGSLSVREREILVGITSGASNKEIARTLDIAETTVKTHVQHVLHKLGVSSRVHAAVLASENRLV